MRALTASTILLVVLGAAGCSAKPRPGVAVIASVSDRIDEPQQPTEKASVKMSPQGERPPARAQAPRRARQGRAARVDATDHRPLGTSGSAGVGESEATGTMGGAADASAGDDRSSSGLPPRGRHIAEETPSSSSADQKGRQPSKAILAVAAAIVAGALVAILARRFW